LAIASACLAAFAAALIAESARMKIRDRLPLRMVVTGTRGKSSVVRLLFSILRSSGLRTVAKTTGSIPVYMHAGGGEEEILRRGKPTILEQKAVLRRAAAEGAEACVVEAMSIRPEVLRAEIGRVIRPQILVVTNVRLDHLGDQGATRERIAAAFASSIPQGSVVFIPEEEDMPVFHRAAEKRSARVIPVPAQSGSDLPGPIPPLEFAPNVRLAAAVARHLEVDESCIRSGILDVSPDFGSLRMWDFSRLNPPRRWQLVSAFAANDPVSTEEVLERLLSGGQTSAGLPLVGLLNLRVDRADRSLQWKKALEEGALSRLNRIYVTGVQAPALARSVKAAAGRDLVPIKAKSAPAVCEKIFALEPEGAVVLGMGNMSGLGRKIVEFWSVEGETDRDSEL